MALRIAPARSNELPLVYDIMQASFAEYLGKLSPPSGVHSETLDDTIHAISEGGALLAWLDGRAVGSVRYAFRKHSCYVGRVSVLPEARGQGIASAMMTYIERIAREHGSDYMEITVRMILESNIHLYERLGFRISHVYEHPSGSGMVADMTKLF